MWGGRHSLPSIEGTSPNTSSFRLAYGRRAEQPQKCVLGLIKLLPWHLPGVEAKNVAHAGGLALSGLHTYEIQYSQRWDLVGSSLIANALTQM